MYYISDYRKQSIDKIIPYLIEFPQIVKTIEVSSDRYQAIEDLLWSIANNFYLQDSRGVFLLAHAHNEESNVIYTDKADDAFTYGTKIPEKQAYGAGHYYSQVGYLSGIKKDISEEKLIRAVQAKIIENNTNGTISDLIEALKLYYNAEKIGILESYPLSVSITLSGDNLELSSFGNKELIKEFLPACVSLKYVYVDDKQYNIYQFSKETSYGDARLARDITDGVLSYIHLHKAIRLYSSLNEHIKTNYDKLDENMYCCFTGELPESYAGNILLSSNNTTTNKSFKLIINEQNYFELIYDDTAYTSDILAEAGKKYTFILHNSNNKLNLWISSSVTITGEEKDKDEAYIVNQISNVQPSISIDNYNTIENGTLYINGLYDGSNVISGDFIYYAIIFGFYDILNNTNDMYDYYITSYGNKQILFNCLSNTNHLKIYSDDIDYILEHVEPEVLQSDFHYAKEHGNGKYAYFNGKSNINYNTSDIEKYIAYSGNNIDNFKLDISLCSPLNLIESNIISGFIQHDIIENNLFITDNNGLVLTLPILNTSSNTYQQLTLVTPDNILFNNIFNNISIIYDGNKIEIYNNSNIIYSLVLADNLKIVYQPPVLNIGNDEFMGLIKEINLDYGFNDDILNINLPYMYTLRDDINKILYTNNGVRLITTPQLMDDKNKLDLYGNTLIGIR